MRLKEDKDSYRSSAIIYRDNRHDHSERFFSTRKRKNTKRWCRGKKGILHVYQEVKRSPIRLFDSVIVTERCVNCRRKETKLLPIKH